MFEDGDVSAGADTRSDVVDTSVDRVDTRTEQEVAAPAPKRLFAAENGLILGRYKDNDAALKALQHYRSFVSGGKQWNQETWKAIGEADGFTPSTSAPEVYEGHADILNAAGLNGDAEDAVALIGERHRKIGLTQEQSAAVLADQVEFVQMLTDAKAEAQAPQYNPEQIVEHLNTLWGDQTDSRIQANREFVEGNPILREALDLPLGESVVGCIIIDAIRGLLGDDTAMTEQGGPVSDDQVAAHKRRIEELMNSPAFNDKHNPDHKKVVDQFMKANEQLAAFKARKEQAAFGALKF